MLAIILIFVLIYPLMNRNDPLEMVATCFEAPSSEYTLGTDNFGRDVLLELAWGARNSFYIGLVAGLVATFIGLVLGLTSGYIGGLVDNIITTITNIFIVIPSFIVLILISVSINSRSSIIISLIIAFTSWPWTARAVRSQTLSLRNREHVNIAKISGYSTLKIMVLEIFPYIASYLMMAFILQISSGILKEAAISILGLGPHNTITLGIMMNWAMLFEAPAAGAWWAFLPPTILIATIVSSLFFMNTGMDEIFNPKIRS
jgi:peptide/nickel transport system permease protein